MAIYYTSALVPDNTTGTVNNVNLPYSIEKVLGPGSPVVNGDIIAIKADDVYTPPAGLYTTAEYTTVLPVDAAGAPINTRAQISGVDMPAATNILSANTTNLTLLGLSLFNSKGSGLVWGQSINDQLFIIGCDFYNNTSSGIGFQSTSRYMTVIAYCRAWNNGGAGLTGFAAPNRCGTQFYRCAAWNNAGGDNISSADTYVSMQGSIVECATYGASRGINFVGGMPVVNCVSIGTDNATNGISTVSGSAGFPGTTCFINNISSNRTGAAYSVIVEGGGTGIIYSQGNTQFATGANVGVVLASSPIATVDSKPYNKNAADLRPTMDISSYAATWRAVAGEPVWEWPGPYDFLTAGLPEVAFLLWGTPIGLSTIR